MGRHRVVRQGFHGGVTTGRCVEGNCFIMLLVQLGTCSIFAIWSADGALLLTPSFFLAVRSLWPWKTWQTNCFCPFLVMLTSVLWSSLQRRRPWRPSWGRGLVATRSCHIGLGLFPRLLLLLTVWHLLHFGSVSSSLTLILIMLWSHYIFD